MGAKISNAMISSATRVTGTLGWLAVAVSLVLPFVSLAQDSTPTLQDLERYKAQREANRYTTTPICRPYQEAPCDFHLGSRFIRIPVHMLHPAGGVNSYVVKGLQPSYTAFLFTNFDDLNSFIYSNHQPNTPPVFLRGSLRILLSDTRELNLNNIIKLIPRSQSEIVSNALKSGSGRVEFYTMEYFQKVVYKIVIHDSNIAEMSTCREPTKGRFFGNCVYQMRFGDIHIRVGTKYAENGLSDVVTLMHNFLAAADAAI